MEAETELNQSPWNSLHFIHMAFDFTILLPFEKCNMIYSLYVTKKKEEEEELKGQSYKPENFLEDIWM